MKKQIFALLSLLLVVSLPFSALADVASGSNAVYGDPFWDRLDTYSALGNVVNTVKPDGLSVSCFFYNPDYDRIESYDVPVTQKNGKYHINTTLTNNGYIVYMQLTLRGKCCRLGDPIMSALIIHRISVINKEFEYWWTKIYR